MSSVIYRAKRELSSELSGETEKLPAWWCEEHDVQCTDTPRQFWGQALAARQDPPGTLPTVTTPKSPLPTEINTDFTKEDEPSPITTTTVGTAPVPSVTGTSSTGSSGSGASTKVNGAAIAGGVVGCLILVALIILGGFWWQRRQRERIPPSAEFNNVAGSLLRQTPNPSSPSTAGYSTVRTMDIGADGTAPPPFSPGGYVQPVFEKRSAGP